MLGEIIIKHAEFCERNGQHAAIENKGLCRPGSPPQKVKARAGSMKRNQRGKSQEEGVRLVAPGKWNRLHEGPKQKYVSLFKEPKKIPKWLDWR